MALLGEIQIQTFDSPDKISKAVARGDVANIMRAATASAKKGTYLDADSTAQKIADALQPDASGAKKTKGQVKLSVKRYLSEKKNGWEPVKDNPNAYKRL